MVTGVADKGAGAEAYTVTSETFALTAHGAAGRGSGERDGHHRHAWSRATPTPAPTRSIALPRRVRTGTATLDVNGQTVQAGPRLRRSCASPPRAAGATVSVDQVEDGCGNASG